MPHKTGTSASIRKNGEDDRSFALLARLAERNPDVGLLSKNRASGPLSALARERSGTRAKKSTASRREEEADELEPSILQENVDMHFA